MNEPSEKALEARARRAALRVGLMASKSRWRRGSCDNQGGFTIVNCNNHVVAGDRWDMSAQEVIDYCHDVA